MYQKDMVEDEEELKGQEEMRNELGMNLSYDEKQGLFVFGQDSLLLGARSPCLVVSCCKALLILIMMLMMMSVLVKA